MVTNMLQNCINSQKSTLCLDGGDGIYENLVVVKWKYCRTKCLCVINFDPWTGNELFTSTEHEVRHILDDDYNVESAFDDNFLIDIDISAELKESAYKKYYTRLSTLRNQHLNSLCSELIYEVDPVASHLSPIIQIPNIRTYAILNKKEYGGFEAMDYCPFCGAKFPEKLDKKLSEILVSEYGLNSWKDYKKAPHEFHTDEWWKKRGL